MHPAFFPAPLLKMVLKDHPCTDLHPSINYQFFFLHQFEIYKKRRCFFKSNKQLFSLSFLFRFYFLFLCCTNAFKNSNVVRQQNKQTMFIELFFCVCKKLRYVIYLSIYAPIYFLTDLNSKIMFFFILEKSTDPQPNNHNQYLFCSLRSFVIATPCRISCENKICSL
jgi:hypothetical protein